MDTKLSYLLSRASSPNVTFYFRGGGQHPVLYLVYKWHNQLVLPSGGGFHDTGLQELHETALIGHLGLAKTLEALQARFWWPHMRADVEAYVAAWPKCQRIKDCTTTKPGLLIPLPAPIITIDILLNNFFDILNFDNFFKNIKFILYPFLDIKLAKYIYIYILAKIWPYEVQLV